LAIGILGIFVLVFGVANLALLVWSLYVILTTPADSWDAIGMSQMMWLLVVLLLPFIGPVLFAVVAMPRLKVGIGIAAVTSLLR